MPLPISHLGGTDGGVGWVWDGYLARGRITLLGALPKCGKTTLLTHLLKAFEAGGTFCGRPLVPGSAVVVTEESPDEWAARRNALHRRAPKATDPHGRRRVLKGYGRMSGIPDEWLIEMTEDGGGFTHIDPDAAAVDTREQQEDGRKEELRNAILAVLPADDPDGMTRDEIWERLPDGMRKNHMRFKSVLEAENGKLWVKSGNGGKGTPYRYRRIEMVTHPGEEQGGEE